MGLGWIHARRSLGREIVALLRPRVHAHLDLARRRQGRRSSAGAAPPTRPIPRRRCAIPCRDKLAKARDAERACDRPGCTGTWTWTVTQQLEAFATKRPAAARAVRRLRAEAGGARRQGRSRAPSRAARAASVFSRRAQLIAGRARRRAARRPPPRCAPVRGRLPQAQGPAGPLRHQRLRATSGPGRADEQIQAYAHGPAQRAAAPHVRRVQGRLRRASPTARCAAGPRAARRPGSGRAAISWTPAWRASRRPRRRTACARAASTIYQKLKDVERPCRRVGLQGDLDSTSAARQLARAVRGKTGDPYPQYCENCAKELGDLEDRQVAVQDRQLHRHLDLDEGGAAGGRRAARAQGARGADEAAARRDAGAPTARARPPSATPRPTASERRCRRRGRVAASPAASRTGKQAASRKQASAGARSARPSGAARPASSSSRTRRRWRSPASSARRRSTGRPRASCRPTSAPGPSRRCAARASATRPRRRAPPSARRCATRRGTGEPRRRRAAPRRAAPEAPAEAGARAGRRRRPPAEPRRSDASRPRQSRGADDAVDAARRVSVSVASARPTQLCRVAAARRARQRRASARASG